MPADFDKQEYWHERFSTESAFEWLVPSEVFLSVLGPYLEKTLKSSSSSSPPPRILQLGFGTSDLQNHIRARGFSNVVNVDYEPLAVEHGRLREEQAFGDVRMRYLVADATRLSFGETFDVVVDKSTVDAVSCAGEEAVLRMARGIWTCLSSASGGGVWISLSYSSCRFDIGGLPFDVEVIARLPTAKQRETDPDIFLYCYLLRPKSKCKA